MSKAAEQSTALVTLDSKLQALDTFAAQNGLAKLVDGKGQFSQAIAVASAMDDLRRMLDPELMKAFMKLQGSALGFKTDKDKEGGYGEEVVKEVVIEATLKGFQLVNNQINVIGGRFYATKEGFESFIKRLPAGTLTDLRDWYSTPKLVGDEAVVECRATFKWQGKDIAIPAPGQPALFLPIRVNKGQGGDAILGKAKRKLYAKIYSLITGTEITEGDISDAAPLGGSGAGATPTAAAAGSTTVVAEEMPDEETLKKLDEALAPNAAQANEWLLTQGWIAAGKTYRAVNAARAKRILANVKGFLATCGVK